MHESEPASASAFEVYALVLETLRQFEAPPDVIGQHAVCGIGAPHDQGRSHPRQEDDES